MRILIFQLKKLQKGFLFYIILQLFYTIDDYDKLFYKNAMDIIKESKIKKRGVNKNEGMEH